MTLEGCIEREIKVELNKNQTINPGEWISSTDSLSGISIREDKLAFFKNMQFTSENIFKYKIIDSVEYRNKERKILSSYLYAYDYSDTTKYKIEQRSSSILVLKFKKDFVETYTLKDKK